jgi:hypothetical protein
MRYYSSGKSHRNYKPRQRWPFFSSGKKVSRKRYKQYENTGAIRYSNPFNSSVSVRSFKGLKYAFLPLLAASWAGMLLYLPYFRVTNITYSGEKIIKRNELEVTLQNQLTNKWVPGNNFFMISEKRISEELMAQFPLNAAHVTKVFPNTMQIVVEEKASSVIYDNSESYYLADESGAGIRFLRQVKPSEVTQYVSTSTVTTSAKVASTSTPNYTITIHAPDYKSLKNEFGNYPIIYDLSKRQAAEKEQLLSQDTVKGVIDFYNQVNGGGVVGITYFTIDPTISGVTALTNKTWNIQFDPSSNISSQVSNLKVILNNNRPNSYIDLRFGDRIYWK